MQVVFVFDCTSTTEGVDRNGGFSRRSTAWAAKLLRDRIRIGWEGPWSIRKNDVGDDVIVLFGETERTEGRLTE